MSRNTRPATGASEQSLGADGDQRRRCFLHHLPLVLASAVMLALFMGFPLFDAHAYPHPDIGSGAFPRERRENEATGHGTGPAGATDHAGNHHGPMRHGGDEAEHHDAPHAGPTGHPGIRTEPLREDADHAGTAGYSGNSTAPRQESDPALTRWMQQFTVATGYLGLSFLAVTLLLGPANLVLGRRNPVSTYLRRDVGIWTAIVSVLHVFCAVLIHASHGSGLVASFVHFFVAEDGRPLTNSFGWGNWTGLAATAIALVLLATSNDTALRALKARPWKWLQRLNYALIVLVVLHAFFYGAFLRMTSPFTLLLVLSVIAVLVGQAVGVWLWRRRHSAMAPTVG